MLQLICLFTTEPELDYTVGMIDKTYDIVFKRIFILAIEESEELICSFNIEKGNVRKQLPGAMLVHRKRDTNTMYTINSLNSLVKSENNGILDTNYSVDWTKYRNSLLITSNNELKVLKTKVYQIVNLG
jgi:hypothetical protein